MCKQWGQHYVWFKIFIFYVRLILCHSPISRTTLTDEGVELVVTVMEAKELIRPPNSENVDTFVRVYLVPDETGALQTKVGQNRCIYKLIWRERNWKLMGAVSNSYSKIRCVLVTMKHFVFGWKIRTNEHVVHCGFIYIIAEVYTRF